VFALIREPPSEVQPKRSVWIETRRGWNLLRTTPWFRRFFVIRALFLSVGLATPFYSIHAATEYHAGAQSLGYFVMAAGVTNIFSGPIWSRMLATNPGRVLIWSGGLAAAAGGVALLQAAVNSLPLPLVYVAVFALLELAVEGLTQSSKTYLALMAPPDDRPRFLAISNALLGVLAIGLSGLIGVIAHTIHIYLALGVLVTLALVASVSAVTLKPVSTSSAG
jgi:MFS family permease